VTLPLSHITSLQLWLAKIILSFFFLILQYLCFLSLPVDFSFDRDQQLYFDDTCVVPERLEGIEVFHQDFTIGYL